MINRGRTDGTGVGVNVGVGLAGSVCPDSGGRVNVEGGPAATDETVGASGGRAMVGGSSVAVAAGRTFVVVGMVVIGMSGADASSGGRSTGRVGRGIEVMSTGRVWTDPTVAVESSVDNTVFVGLEDTLRLVGLRINASRINRMSAMKRIHSAKARCGERRNGCIMLVAGSNKVIDHRPQGHYSTTTP